MAVVRPPPGPHKNTPTPPPALPPLPHPPPTPPRPTGRLPPHRQPPQFGRPLQARPEVDQHHEDRDELEPHVQERRQVRIGDGRSRRSTATQHDDLLRSEWSVVRQGEDPSSPWP